MYGDFSRDSFDPCKNYTRVLMQQGRPLTDADWNEQAAALWDHLIALGAATIGWHGSPDKGFSIDSSNGKSVLKAGTYFVDGIRFTNNSDQTPETNGAPAESRLIYLDVWEQPVNAIEDFNIVEPALTGNDTAVRAKIAWALRYTKDEWKSGDPNTNVEEFRKAVGRRDTLPTLRVRRVPTLHSLRPSNDPCEIVGTDGRSVGWSDRLYRVEIHREGVSASSTDDTKTIAGKATFKWSRDNGAVVTALRTDVVPSSSTLNIDRTKFTSRVPFHDGAWVELMDYDGRSANTNRRLVKLIRMSPQQATVEPAVSVASGIAPERSLAASFELKKSAGYFLRQWDHTATPLDQAKNETVASRLPAGSEKPQVISSLVRADDGTALVVQESGKDIWLELEPGLQIQFCGQSFHSGDYWLIRLTSDGRVIVLPDGEALSSGETCAPPARGEHHYAPIGLLNMTPNPPTITSAFRGERIVPVGHGYPEPFPQQGCKPCLPVDSCHPKPTSAMPDPNPTGPTPMAPACWIPVTPHVPINPVSLLSGEGARALKGYLSSPKDVTRRVPARYLNYEPQSEVYRRFRSPLLVSEILETSYEKYLAKVERCVEVSEAERALVEADARADYALAAEFQSLVSSGQGFRPLIA